MRRLARAVSSGSLLFVEVAVLVCRDDRVNFSSGKLTYCMVKDRLNQNVTLLNFVSKMPFSKQCCVLGTSSGNLTVYCFHCFLGSFLNESFSDVFNYFKAKKMLNKQQIATCFHHNVYMYESPFGYHRM